jgi:hypothetical protein
MNRGHLREFWIYSSLVTNVLFGFVKPILGPGAHLLSEARFEALGLLDVERFEVAEPGIGFEPIQSLRDAVERSLAEALGLDQVCEVRALDPLVLRVMRFHGR